LTQLLASVRSTHYMAWVVIDLYSPVCIWAIPLAG
jgi:hypothetical protein